MRQRARMIVEGNVQGVGYRALVKQISRKMGIKGRVKNLDDGSVEIHCEADEKALRKFRDVIEIKSKRPEDILALNVEKIDVKLEGESGYMPPEKELGLFEIDYDEEAKSAFEKVNLERSEIGALILTDVSKNVIIVGEKVDSVGEKIDSGFCKTDSNFKDLDGKYDVVSKELKTMNKNIEKLARHMGTLVEDYISTKRRSPHRG